MRSLATLAATAAAVCLFLSSPAAAQAIPPAGVFDPEPADIVDEERELFEEPELMAPDLLEEDPIDAEPDLFDREPVLGVGAMVAVGGGVTQFVGEDARDLATPGGTWTFRGVLGTRTPIGLEAAYVGAMYGLEEGTPLDDALLLEHGFETAARLQAPFPIGDVLLEPYGLVGVGWRYFLFANQSLEATLALAATEIEEDDNVFTVPMAVGVMTAIGPFALDARVNYRPAFDDELLGGVDGAFDTGLDTWSAAAHAGVEF